VEQELFTLQEHMSSPPFLLVLVGFVLFNVVKLHVFAFLVQCCDVRVRFPRKNDVRFVFTPICEVKGSCAIFVFVFTFYLFTYIGVQHDFHIR